MFWLNTKNNDVVLSRLDIKIRQGSRRKIQYDILWSIREIVRGMLPKNFKLEVNENRVSKCLYVSNIIGNKYRPYNFIVWFYTYILRKILY